MATFFINTGHERLKDQKPTKALIVDHDYVTFTVISQKLLNSLSRFGITQPNQSIRFR